MEATSVTSAASLAPIDVVASLCRIDTADSVDETRVVDLGGVPQVVSMRGKHRSNPVLLMAHGGPGTPLAPTAWMWQRAVEDYFTVVQYDQRAAGRSYQLSDPEKVRHEMAVERYVQDAVELATWVRLELDVDRVVMAGHSWGSIVGLGAVLEAPNLFWAYLGMGQVISFRRGEQLSFEWARSEAERLGLVDAVAELDSLASYAGDGPIDIADLIVERSWVGRLGGFAAGRDNCDYFVQGGIASPDYGPDDRDSTSHGNALSVTTLLPELLNVDLSGVTRSPVPVVQFLGRHDHMTPTSPVIEWLSALEAPSKAVEWFEDSAHMMMYEEPGHFLTALLAHVLPLCSPQNRD